MTTALTPGQVAYAAYGKARNWVTVNGMAMPAWDDQLPELKVAWEQGAAAVIAEHISDGWIASPIRPEDEGQYQVVLDGDEVTTGWWKAETDDTSPHWLILDSDLFDPIEQVLPEVLNCTVTHWRSFAAPPKE